MPLTACISKPYLIFSFFFFFFFSFYIRAITLSLSLSSLPRPCLFIYCIFFPVQYAQLHIHIIEGLSVLEICVYHYYDIAFLILTASSYLLLLRPLNVFPFFLFFFFFFFLLSFFFFLSFLANLHPSLFSQSGTDRTLTVAFRQIIPTIRSHSACISMKRLHDQ